MLFYAARVKYQLDGTYLLTFRDIPEASVRGQTPEQVLRRAEEVLAKALESYVVEKRPLPHATRTRRGERSIYLNIQTTCRVMFYEAMRLRNLGVTDLAEKLGVDVHAAEQLLDVTGRTTIDDLTRVASALDLRVTSHVG